jgi:CRISPR-associated protein Cmr4
MKTPYERRTYAFLAVDPVHIGTGGYGLGRVDNTIMRDPATHVPIIPGSTIAGTCRTYAAYKLFEDTGEKERLNCIGKDTEKARQCGDCDICHTFGYSKANKSMHALAQFSDAQILFFPVYSIKGTVWVTCPSALKQHDEDSTVTVDKEKAKVSKALKQEHDKINLGWLYLDIEGDSLGTGIKGLPDKVNENTVVVGDKLFSQVVNSNLDVRTSVSINAETGAAEEGALFTYEAIPRGTVLWFDVTYINPAVYGKGETDSIKAQETVETGLGLFEHLGVGGMVTKGFGRMSWLTVEKGGRKYDKGG